MSDVKFIRVNGRVIPIKQKTADRTVAAGGVGGALVAADALRTKQMYNKNGITIDKKKFSVQPFVWNKLGDRMVLKKDGKMAAHAMYYKGAFDGDKKSFGFSWLGVKKQFRGSGLSKILSKEVAKDMKSQGGKYVWNQVVHHNSLQTNFSKARDTLYKAKDLKDGSGVYTKVTKKSALANVNFYRKVKGIYTSDVFRETSLKHVRKASNGIRTVSNKLKIGIGLGIAAASAIYLNNRRKK